MKILKDIKDNTLLIIPNNLKPKILKELDLDPELKNIKIMSLEDIKKQLMFDYNNETILYLMNRYNIKYNVAKIYIENMYYLNDCLTSSDKVNQITLIKNNLLSHNLLKIDNLFKEYIKNKNIIIYGYDYYTKQDLKLVEQLKKDTNVSLFYKIESPKKDIVVYEFNTIQEEVEYVAIKIVELIKKGIKLERIKISNIDNEYIKEIRKIFKFYNIPINLNEKVSLYDLNISKEFITLLKKGHNYEEIISIIEKKYKPELVNKIISVINNNIFIKEINNNTIEILVTELKNTTLKQLKLKDSIEIIDIYNNEIEDDTYVFILGFNNGQIPKIIKDEDFISDKIKQELGIDTSYEINKLVKDATINICNTINNLTITYKLKTAFEDYYPSNLIKDYNMIVEKPDIDYKISYSKIYNDIKLGKIIDKLIKYREKDPNLSLLYNNSSYKFLTYDNKFKGIEKKDLYEYLDNKLLLSYSTLDNFYHCNFRYYLTNILKIDTFNDTLSTKIGNIFHYILSIKDKDDFNLEQEYENQIKKLDNLTPKDIFYLNKLKKELKEILKVLKYHQQISGLNNSYYERKFYIDKSNSNIKITFMGIIDKILYTDKGSKKIISIIDYKTGNTNINLKEIEYGLGMQLPSYIYLIKNSNEFKDAKITGIYLQNILNKINCADNEKDNEYKKALKLNGYSTPDESYLELFDTTYENSEMINGMRKKQDGSFYNYTKLLSDNEINNIERIVNNKINNAIEEILNADFKINPKRLNNEIIGCEFCKFKDICYKTEKDIVDIQEHKDLSFLGGDQNA